MSDIDQIILELKCLGEVAEVEGMTVEGNDLHPIINAAWETIAALKEQHNSLLDVYRQNMQLVSELQEQNALLTVQVQRHQWQPIETAPRDGTPVDLWHKSGGRIPETWWDEEDQCWSCVMDDDCFSHWMPIPPPPIQSATQPDREANG